jgi:hypothetical protein
VPQIPPRKYRAQFYTPELLAEICRLIRDGYSEKEACIKAGVIPGRWWDIKVRRPDIREAVIAAKRVAVRRQLEKEQEREAELRSLKRSSITAKRPPSRTLPRDIQLVRWFLVSGVPLDVGDLSRSVIESACNRYGVDYARLVKYDQRHDIVGWVIKKRAKMRGEHLLGKPEPERLEADFKMHPIYGAVRKDSGSRLVSK